MKRSVRIFIVSLMVMCAHYQWAHADMQAAMQAYNAQDFKTAYTELLKEAEAGNVDAQVYLSGLYFNGQGVEKDPDKAFKWTLSAAEQGHAFAQFNTGNLYQRGLGTTADMNKAVEWFEKSARQGNTQAQMTLGHLYSSGKSIAKDKEKAYLWYYHASVLGLHHRKLIETSLSDSVLTKLNKQAREESVQIEAQRTDADKKAIQDLQKNIIAHANNNNPEAKMALGVMYHDGIGVKQDVKQAFDWFKQAAEQGNRDAQYYLGREYYTGHGVPMDDKKAAEWWFEAATQGHPKAQHKIGNLFVAGRGVPRNKDEAYKWYKLAARQGNPEGQLVVANMYRLGQGVEKDMVQAAAWYHLSGNAGAGVLTNSKYKFTSEDIEAGKKLALDPGFRHAAKIDMPKSELPVKKKITAKKVPVTKKTPYCGEKKQLDDWNVEIWPGNITLRPKLYDLQGTGKWATKDTVNVVINGSQKGIYSFSMHHYQYSYSLTDRYELWVDGRRIFEGKWRSEKSADGKSTTDTRPRLTAEHVKQLEQGQIAEARMIKKGYASLGESDQIIASAKFSIKKFADVHQESIKEMKRVKANKVMGLCR